MNVSALKSCIAALAKGPAGVRNVTQILSRACVQTSDLFSSNFKRGFQCFAQQQARYLIGEGWKRNAYIGGLAKSYARTVHHGASCPAYPAPCPPDTPASDRRNANALPGGLIWAPLVRRTLHIFSCLLLWRTSEHTCSGA